MAEVLLSPSHIGQSVRSSQGGSRSGIRSGYDDSQDSGNDTETTIADIDDHPQGTGSRSGSRSGSESRSRAGSGSRHESCSDDSPISSLLHHHSSPKPRMRPMSSTETKRERPKSSFLDSPTHTLPANLADFLKIENNTSDHNQSIIKKNKSPSMRKPFLNLSNFVTNITKKGLARAQTTLNPGLPTLTSSSNKEEPAFSPPNSPTAPKKNSNKTIRRIHSMYHTHKEKETFSMEDNSILSQSTLNHFKVDNDLLPRISHDDMYNILLGKHNHEFDDFVIIDSRFNYEFNGGHIEGAVNISCQQELENKFIHSVESTDSKRKLVIFHCEFSIFRGPTMASHLRKCDRIRNSNNYPNLTYPDIVILEGGYKKFYDKYKAHCEPQAYIEMKDINHRKACELEMDRVRQASKLTRAKSYTQFGIQPPLHHRPSSKSLVRPHSFQHTRSNSYTTVTSHAENLKILKRQRSMSKVNLSDIAAAAASVSTSSSQPSGQQSPMESSPTSLRAQRSSTISYSQSIFNSSPTRSPLANGSNPSFPTLDEDFQPPTALFKSSNGLNRRSINTLSSSSSINSYSSEGSAFSSTESLSDSYSSPMTEFTDFFDQKGQGHGQSQSHHMKSNFNPYPLSKAGTSVLNPLAKKPSSALPQLPGRPNASNHQFKFPMQGLKPKTSRTNLNRINTSKAQQQAHNTFLPTASSSPVISSPLSTITPASDSGTLISSLIDPINDTPVDFSVPTKHSKHSRRRSGSLLSSGCYNFISLDIDEIDEEDDNDADGTLTDIKLSTEFIQKNPFNN